VESGIVDILKRLPIKFSCLHVKGHQDEETSVAALPWEAQMNCHADACTTDCLDSWSETAKTVPFIPASSQASISIAGVTIARNVAREDGVNEENVDDFDIHPISRCSLILSVSVLVCLFSQACARECHPAAAAAAAPSLLRRRGCRKHARLQFPLWPCTKLRGIDTILFG
jgi:hypothetical protein